MPQHPRFCTPGQHRSSASPPRGHVRRRNAAALALCSAAAMLASGLAGAGRASAATSSWINPDGGSWADPANWSAAGVPGSTDMAFFDLNAPAPYTVSAPGQTTIGDLYVARDSVQLNLTGGTMVLTDTTGVALSLGVFTGDHSSLALAGGGTIVSSSNIDVGNVIGSFGTMSLDGAETILRGQGPIGLLSVGERGTGTLLISNGAAGSLSAGAEIGYAGAGTAILTNGGQLIDTGIHVAVGLQNTGVGVLQVLSGSKVRELAPADFGEGYAEIDAGMVPGSQGTILVDGNGSEMSSTGQVVIGQGGAGTLTISGGGQVLSSPNSSTSTVDPTLSGSAGRGAGSSGAVTITGAGSQWTQTGVMAVGYSGTGTLTVSAGGALQTLGGAVARNTGSSGDVTITGAGSRWIMDGGLSVGGSSSGAGGTAVVRVGSGGLLQSKGVHVWNNGTVNWLDGGSISTGALALSGGGKMLLDDGHDKVPRVGTLSVDAANGSRLDLADNAAIVDYTGASPAAPIRSWLTSGFNGGAWNGNGISSTTAAAEASSPHKTALGYGEASSLFTSFPATFAGQSVDDTSVLIRYTANGDANLDGTVDTLDFNALAANFGGTSKVWTQGDFNYDSVVDTLDFNAMAANFGYSVPAIATSSALASPGSLVPEPSGGLFLLLAATALVTGRRRRMQN